MEARVIALVCGLSLLAMLLLLFSFDRPVEGLASAPGPAPVPVLAPQAGPWETACVDCPRWFNYWAMTERSMRLDAASHPHVAYGGDHLYHAWYDGTAWNYETADGAPRVGTYPSLALDAAGRPHISYYDETHIDLKYAFRDAAGWHVETVIPEGLAGFNTSLALDPSGRPHIAYCEMALASGSTPGVLPDTRCEQLMYAWHDGSTWQVETVDAETQAGWSLSLALDAEGRPAIAYGSGYLSPSLKYARQDGDQWQIESVVQLREGNFTAVSLVLDEQDRPHLVYGRYRNAVNWQNLEYAWRDATGWHSETVDDRDPIYRDPIYRALSLQLDGSGLPHISYARHSDLGYAAKEETGWRLYSPENEVVLGHTSLALDPTGGAHLVYLGAEAPLSYGPQLRYARQDGADWPTQVVDRAAQATAPSLALDAVGGIHVAFVNRNIEGHPEGNLIYSWQEGATWNAEVVDSGGGAAAPSLALDRAGDPRISYFAAGLRYAWRAGGIWHTEPIISELDIDTTRLALDSMGQPHVVYCYHGALRYALRGDCGWQIETVAGGGCADPSLVLDAQDQPHIAVCKMWDMGSDLDGCHRLDYAWRDAGTWQTKTVESGYFVGAAPSLVLDAEGRPRVSYRVSVDGVNAIHFARKDGDTWHVDSAVNVAESGGNALALDSAGRPFIGFYDSVWGALRVAWHGGAWQLETVEPRGGNVYVPSDGIAVDPLGGTTLVYEDSTLGDVRVARRPMVFLSLHKEATPGQGVAVGQPVTFTLTAIGPGLAAELWDPLPANVALVSGTLTGTLEPAPVYSPTAHAVGWHGTLPLTQGQVITFRVTPVSSGTGTLVGAPPFANTVWLREVPKGGWISSTVIVNELRFYLPLVARKG
jgi:hypothetical protein